MSIRIMSIVWNEANLRPTEKLILLFLAQDANDSGEACMSLKEIGKGCGGLSRQQVIRVLKKLEQIGYITRVHRFVDGWSRTSNSYIVNIDVVGSGENQYPKEDEGIVVVPISEKYENIFPDHHSTAKSKRNTFEKSRKRIFLRLGERDGFHCQICKATTDLTVDHIVPLTKDGPNDLSNLQILCRTCNSRKGSKFEEVEA